MDDFLYKVDYSNKFSIEENIFIKIYKSLNKHSTNYFVKTLKYLLFIIFKRFAFQLLKSGVKFSTTAYYEKDIFLARATNSQFHSIYFDQFSKCYEPDVFAAIDIFVPQNGVFVDIGSNWGHHSIIAAKSKKAEVYAFEPNKLVYNDLQDIVKSLKCEKYINISNSALGSERTTIKLKQNSFESGVASISNNFLRSKIVNGLWPEKLFNKITLSRPIEEEVKIERLDSIINKEININLIKLDTEGAEFDCLLGCSNILKSNGPKVLFELHTHKDGSFNEFKKFFKTFDYDLYEIKTDVKLKKCWFKKCDSLKSNRQYNILASKERI